MEQKEQSQIPPTSESQSQQWFDDDTHAQQTLSDQTNGHQEDKDDHKVVDLKELDEQEDESEFKDVQSELQPSYDLEQAKRFKEQANEEFKFERYTESLKLYEQAIKICPPEEINDLAIFYNNRGICFTKLKQNKEARKEFTKAIETKSDYVKPRAFRMKINKDEEEYDQALEDAKKIEEIEPTYPGIHRTVRELDQLQKEKFEKMKNEVMGNLKSFGNTILGKFGMSIDNFKMQQNQDGTYNLNYQNQ